MGPRAPECVASVWLSVAEAAVELDRSPRQVYRWIEKGWLPAYRIGKVAGLPLRVKRVDVERLLVDGLPA